MWWNSNEEVSCAAVLIWSFKNTAPLKSVIYCGRLFVSCRWKTKFDLYCKQVDASGSLCFYVMWTFNWKFVTTQIRFFPLLRAKSLMFCGSGLKEVLFQLVLFIPRELRRHLWKKQAVLRWKKEVSQHWHNHCTELRLPRTSESLPYHFCTWSRAQLRIPGELLWCATLMLCEKEFIKLVRFVPSSFNLRYFSFSTTLDLSAHQANPRVKTRRRREIISCMQELHQETSSTTISSPFAVCATSARFWRKRGATVS